MDDALRPRSDAGFSIVELLVAVAIASLVIIAIGALFAVGLRVRDRAADNAAVQSTLIDLQVLTEMATSEVGLEITEPSETEFRLEAVQEGRAGLVDWKALLVTSESRVRIELRRGSNTSSVDLSAFDTTAIEYLVISSQAPSWTGGAGVGGSDVRAARLRLSLGQRVWRPLIWIASANALHAP